jgi:hypothetical protein
VAAFRWVSEGAADPLVHLGSAVPGDHPFVLTEEAFNGKTNTLDGLKGNGIVDRLIPAGTGAVMGGLREVATGRDQLILDEREKEQVVKTREQPAQLRANAAE